MKIRKQLQYVLCLCLALLCGRTMVFGVSAEGASEGFFVRTRVQKVSAAECQLSPDVAALLCNYYTLANCDICLPCLKDVPPAYYCECMMSPVQKPGMDTVVTGEIWFSGTVTDVIDGGMTAYWFSKAKQGQLTLSLYLSCSDLVPMKNLYIWKNNAYMLTPDSIMALVNKQGAAGMLETMKASNVPVRIRVQPQDTVEGGRMLVFRYGDGFHSTCEETFPVYFNIPYAYSWPDNVYSLSPANAKKLKWVHWEPVALGRQEVKGPVSLSVRRGSCTGEVLWEHTFRDETRAWFPDTLALQALGAQRDTLYFDFSGTNRGILRFYSTEHIGLVPRDSVLCKGQTYWSGSEGIMRDTVLNDTLWVAGDSLKVNSLRLTFTPADTVRETLTLRASELGKTYYGKQIDDYGDFRFVRNTGCDVWYELHVEPLWTYTTKTTTYTECLGKALYYKRVGLTPDKQKVAYYANTTLRDTVTTGRDTRRVDVVKLVFTQPDVQTDTISLLPEELPYTYRGQKITSFGTRTLTIKVNNQCTEKVKLSVLERERPLTRLETVIDTMMCKGLWLELQDTTVMTPGPYTDSIFLAKDTLLTRYWKLSYREPELEERLDSVRQSLLPLRYGDSLLYNFGTYDIVLARPDTCEEHIRLTLVPQAEYINQRIIDTTLCRGMAFRLGGKTFTADTLVSDTLREADYLCRVRSFALHFLKPEPEYLTDSLYYRDLPYAFGDTLIRDYGTYELYKEHAGACDTYTILTLLPRTEYIFQHEDTVLCHGRKMLIGDKTFTETCAYQDTVPGSLPYTQIVRTWNISFTPALIEQQTRAVRWADMPFAVGDTLIGEYGVYVVQTTGDDVCDTWTELNLVPEIVYTAVEADTVLCAGKTYLHGGKAFEADTVLTDTIASPADYSAVVRTLHVRFLPEETVLDHLVLTAEQLPYDYHGRILSDFGPYTFETEGTDGCRITVELLLEEATGLETVPADRLMQTNTARAGELLTARLPRAGVLRVVDMLGRVVWRQQVPAGKCTFSLPVAGHYAVQWTDGECTKTEKLQIKN